MKALIWKADYAPLARVKGQIEMIMSANALMTWTGQHLSRLAQVELPIELEDVNVLDIKVVYNETSEAFELSLDPTKDKVARIKAKYDDMTNDILAQMKIVFGTSSTESATAYKETFSMMLADPSEYSVINLTARFDIGLINIGDVLDTDAKILEYAQGKVNDIKAYGVFRMQRIEQFKTEKALIEAE